MNEFSANDASKLNAEWSLHQQIAMIGGEILVKTRSHSDWGGAVTATMYLPLVRSHVWQQVTDYPRWVQYFPDVTKSEVLHRGEVEAFIPSGEKSLFVFYGASRSLSKCN